ncbi:hypothetical protein MIND_00813100 [Mycena indigotica]|uniref:BTB domain-containing protein n=1 Tax=Mycena indigotica TaxID=2126181 RepID=A0A8H6W468_9AGAR|nr:uncharacterized protein MIND_00813100 [Mycena indigotica]KAF7298659.1 hypothetical protein MIND_00813100 [Mycena indigotica]
MRRQRRPIVRLPSGSRAGEEPRDSPSTSPSRARPAIDKLRQQTSNYSHSGMDLDSSVVHDETYFFDDGDCLFQVENVLFNLHRVILGRDPESMFRSMFADAQGSSAEVISLSGDTAAEFRVLCWAMYLLPGDAYALSMEQIGDTEVKKYLDLLNMAHKYTLPHFEKWAWEMLSSVEDMLRPLQTYLNGCLEPGLEAAMALAIRCNLSSLLDLVLAILIKSAKSGAISASRVLVLGEKYQQRSLQTEIYIILWNRVQGRQDEGQAALIVSPLVGLGTQLGLTNAQMQRFFTGIVMLTSILAQIVSPGDPGTPCVYPSKECPCAGSTNEWRLMLAENRQHASKSTRTEIRAILQNAQSYGDKYRCIDEHLKSKNFCSDIDTYFLGPEPSTSS